MKPRAQRTDAVTRLAHMAGENSDRFWMGAWVAGLGALWLWDIAFLNRPALAQLEKAFANTLLGGVLVVVFTLVLGHATALGLYFLERRPGRVPYLLFTFLLNLLRSIPQIVGILIGYVILTFFIQHDVLRSSYTQIVWTAFLISLFTFQELVDVIRERIEHFRQSDFFDAMLCSGVRESRIINVDVLWRNSLAHIVHKLIATFGRAVFLQCSIDFIISVGLSTDVSLSNFPPTLGGLLATMDSKQDILAVSVVFSDPGYLGQLLVRHLQGISVAFLIVFTLICIHKIANGFVRRYNL